jgi:two-component system chemotaxis sensor kinase CheA
MTDNLLEYFIIEARELVQQATDDFLALERNPTAAARLDSAFRAVHTLKGSAGLFDFAPMGLALHAAEDLLGAVREGQAALDVAAVDDLLEFIAQMERWISAIEQKGYLPTDTTEEGHRLARALRSRLDTAATGGFSEMPVVDYSWADALIAASPEAEALFKAGDMPLIGIRYTPRADCFFTGDDPMALLRSIPDLVSVRISSRDPWPSVSDLDPFSCNLRIDALSCARLEEVKAVFRFVPDQVTLHEILRPVTTDVHDGTADDDEAGHTAFAVGGISSRMLRIDAKRIDRLADLVGEMVIAKNALAHLALQVGEEINRKDLAQGILSNQATIDRLVADMHRAVMDVRMMPMRDIFQRFPRTVREIAGQLGKGIDFSMEGEGVEADKSIVEGLFEPLLHMIRNAISHGAEPESVRSEAGKRGRTKVILRARRESDHVAVEIEDDGSGINPALIRQVAQERGVLANELIDRMTDAEAIDLIFAPGFSTASEITNLSGRGVGMDAVRTAIEKMGGRVSIHSTQGRGTTIRLSLPLTVVMTKVMMVQVGGELYGIPIDLVVETAFVPLSRVLPIQDAEAFVLRDQTLPLLRLADLLSIDGAKEARASAAGPGVKVLVVALEGDLIGIAVDRFAERADILMRPMTGILANMPGVMGTTLLGNGRVLMILDIQELIG